MQLITKPFPRTSLQTIAQKTFGDLIKAVVDIEKEVMVIDAELHADQEQWLLAHGSKQENLWGINLYPGNPDTTFIEFDSMINIRPQQNNLNRTVINPKIQESIRHIVNKLII
jgi:hypothetical protein